MLRPAALRGVQGRDRRGAHALALQRLRRRRHRLPAAHLASAHPPGRDRPVRGPGLDRPGDHRNVRGTALHTTGTVAFRARFTDVDGPGVQVETSAFERVDGDWFYVEAVDPAAP
ncbi:hypothetical protein GCM10029992_48500 [Glycomyces albus]